MSKKDAVYRVTLDKTIEADTIYEAKALMLDHIKQCLANGELDEFTLVNTTDPTETDNTQFDVNMMRM
jgi:hypothetical protein